MSKVQFILAKIKEERERMNVSLADVAKNLNIGEDWLEAVENGLTPPTFGMMYAITQSAKIDLAEIIKSADSQPSESFELARTISASDDGAGNLIFNFQYNDYKASYILNNANISQYNQLLSSLREMTYDNNITKSEFVIRLFFKAMKLWPDANPSDIWGFFLSRLYQDPYNHPVSEQNRDFAQSWKRTSGWVLEEIFVRHYKEFLNRHGITIGIFTKNQVKSYLQKMNLNYHDVEEKADVLVIDNESGECCGVIHVKASLAERRQADQSFSEALLAKNYFSPFMTMDCKSFPSANPQNKGELGPTKSEDADERINKRLDFEEEGYFSACFSYNSNTLPTPLKQKATSRIYTMDFKDPNDQFTKSVISARDRLFSG